jgi:hypothetical protein
MHAIQKLTATLALAGVCGAASAAGHLVITPASKSVTPGASFSLKVRGDAFSDSLVGGGFNLGFDPALLSLDSVAINTALWEFAPAAGAINNATGKLSDVAFNSFLNSPTGGFEAATLNFTAKAAGTGMVTLSASPSFPFANTGAEVVAVTFGSAQVTAAVPEPASLAMMLLGLGVLPLVLRRRA